MRWQPTTGRWQPPMPTRCLAGRARMQDFALPSRSDLRWMEGALGALLAYMDAHMKSDQGVVQPADLIRVGAPRRRRASRPSQIA